MSSYSSSPSFKQRFESMVDASLKARSGEIVLDIAAGAGDRFRVNMSNTLNERYQVSAAELEQVLRGDELAWAEWSGLFEAGLHPSWARICHDTRHGCIRFTFPSPEADGLVRVVGGASYQFSVSARPGRCVR